MTGTAPYPRLLSLVASIVVVAVLYLAKGVLIPFALAMLASFLMAPLVLRLQRWRFSRVMAVLTAVLFVFIASSATTWLVAGQVRDVATRLTEYKQNIRGKLAAVRGAVTRSVESATRVATEFGGEPEPGADTAAPAPPIQTVRIAEPPQEPFEVLRNAFGSALDALITTAMALLFALVMLLRRDDLGDRFIRIVGHGNILVTTRALEEAGRKVSSYLWRLLLLNGIHGLVVGIGLTCIGVPNAILWGVLAAILRFIPFVGAWIAATFPVLTALAVFPGWTQPMLAIALFVILELVSNNLLEPWLYGKGTGISPLAILVSALFWTWLWGPVGLVLSTPLTACLVVIGKHVPQLQFLHLLFGDAPGLSPPARLYQRLIAGDQDQAWIVIREALGQKPLHEVYDSVVLPALSMAERDRQRGTLGEEAEHRIQGALKVLLEAAAEWPADSDAAPAPASAPVREHALRVLCLPAHGAADVLAATMLGQVLDRDGMHVEVSSGDELSGETLDLFESRRVDLVCISAVPPSRFMHVRYLCKRIAARFPKLPILAGMWTLEVGTEEMADLLPILGGVQVVTSIGEARIQVRQVVKSPRVPIAAAVAAGTGVLVESVSARAS